jgi:myo-inositol-1(or 4)-monophosphatase
VVTTWTGGSPAQGGAIVASANRKLHDQVLARLAG